MHSHRNPSVLFLVVTALLTMGLAARAQQDGDVTVIIKAKSKPATLPTLLVMCDLVCNWKLDGEVKGHIDAGGSVKVKVEPGQHMVEAVTEDGFDWVKQPSTVKPTGQTMVNIELEPIRDARLIAEQEAQDQAAQEAAREAQAKAETQQLLEKAAKAARDKAASEAVPGVWADAATGLMWTKKDNGSSVAWKQATDYCRNLQLAGYSDWRLPEIDELGDIYDSSLNVPGHSIDGQPLNWHVKGDLKLSGMWEVSNTREEVPQNSYQPSGKAWIFEFSQDWGKRSTFPINLSGGRALCVRTTGDRALLEQQERERAAREEAAGVTWTDTATGLMWTKKDQGNLNWKQATAYCQNLQLGGHSDWRLPEIEELQGIYDRDSGIAGHNVKGNLQVPRWWEWSSSQGDSSKHVLIFDFKDGIRFSGGPGRDWTVVSWHGDTAALCVRSASR